MSDFYNSNPGLPTEILQFFAVDVDLLEKGEQKPRMLEEFTNQPHHFDTSNVIEIFKIIAFFKNEGLLISLGNVSPTNERLICVNYKEDLAKYGTYDFLIYGFSKIANHFCDSVRPIEIKKSDGSYDIGTGFLLGNGSVMITARHVVEDAESIHITAANGSNVEVSKVIFSEESKIDIALLVISNSVFSGVPGFKIKEAEILEDVLTIGYPPIPGFDAIQIYEKASINNRFKFSKGQIVGKDSSYIDGV